MTILPLVIVPDKTLQLKSKPIDKVDDDIRKLMDDMVETMHENNGIGLAAVQVGVHKRVLVMDFSESEKRYEKTESQINGVDLTKPIYMANPEIIEQSTQQNTYEEGCLSLPGAGAKVTRPKTVKVKYLDYDGNTQIMDCDELLATCVQHEIDHLNGIVFADHLSKLKRDMVLKKVSKVKKRMGDN